jgi:hypothetical protein
MVPAESTTPSTPVNRSFHAATADDCKQLVVTAALQVTGRLLCGTLSEVRAFRL